jgi:hypothetical protein
VPTAVATIHRCLAQIDASENGDLAWLAESLRLWLAGAAWEDALGLRPGWRDHLRQRQQQAALAAIVASLPPMSCRALGDEIEARLRRYEASTFPSDRAAGRRPSGQNGLAYDYLEAGGATSAETLRKDVAAMRKAATMGKRSPCAYPIHPP